MINKMGFINKIIFSVSALLLLSVCFSGQAHSGEVKARVQTMINSVIDVFNDPELKNPEKSRERDRILREKADTIFDWEEMARRTLGRHWRNITPQQREKFTEIFVDFLQRVYLGRLDNFMDQITGLSYDSVAYQSETIQGRFCMVETTIKVGGNTFPVNYRLINKDDTWVVYDVSVEGIGLVANYRTQFDNILNRSSFDELLEQLKSRKPKEEELDAIPSLEESSE